MTAAASHVEGLLHIARRARALKPDGAFEIRPLAEWRELDAYVLLGDPGAGKSESLRYEAQACAGVYVSARDFNVLGIEPEDAGKILFIDGLDEMRAGAANGRSPLDDLRARLKSLGRPQFRLSCREHDWRSQSDLAALSQVAPSGTIVELHLEPLAHHEQLRWLSVRRNEVGDAQAFIQHAQAHRLSSLFGNPLLLDLTIRAVAEKGGWPNSRREIYELACRELALERSPAHLEAKPLTPGAVDRLLDDAGMLCAVLLLSGKGSMTRSTSAPPLSVAWHTLPPELSFSDPIAALASKVFTSTAEEVSPLHRSIAEFLAARAVAKRILQNSLPLGRVLALMQGVDGGVVEPLRGLLGWMAVHNARDRHQIIKLDPLSVVLNGDVAAFTQPDKQALLEALRDEAQRNPWFRNRQWVSYPFAPLASPDMSAVLAHVLSDHSVESSHQALVDCVLDALSHAAPMPLLNQLLEAWVEDPKAHFGNREGALRVWLQYPEFDPINSLSWLNDLQHGRLSDDNHRLSSRLLFSLYPAHLRADEVLEYWPRSSGSISAASSTFWTEGLLSLTRPSEFEVLADAWLRLLPPLPDQYRDSEWRRLRSGILAGALEQSGDAASNLRLHGWLALGLDEYGFSKLEPEAGGRRVVEWLSDRPERMKAVVSIGWAATQAQAESGNYYFWESEQRLHGARLPRDWFHWLLQHAAETRQEELARYCLGQAARACVDPSPGFDVPSMEEIVDWVSAHAQRWPQVEAWLLSAWSSDLETGWQAGAHLRNRKHEAVAMAAREARRAAMAPHLAGLINGDAPPAVLQQLAMACEKRFYDVRGETPEQRVQDYLVSDHDTAIAALQGLQRVLKRDDLPSVDQIFSDDAKGKYHPLRPAALLAAKLAYEHDPGVSDTWAPELLAVLVAWWLSEGLGDMPAWYKQAAKSRPEVVAPVLIRHALPRLRRRGPMAVSGLWALAREPSHSNLARLVLPALLDGFPQRASEPARRELNGALLAALHHLDDEMAAAIVRNKLDHPSIDAAQRICWLVADLRFRPEAADCLVAAVGSNERRLVTLGIALHEQGSLGSPLLRVQADTLASLIELLAPITKPERPDGVRWVGPQEQRGDTVRELIDLLATDPQPAASAALQRLVSMPRLLPWRQRIRFGLLNQQGVAREARFVHAMPEAVALTLANSAPANASDLLALTVDHLRDIERHLRGADDFSVRLFWTAGNGGSLIPKNENECRNVLLGILRARMSALGIGVIPERLAADEMRADLRLEYLASGRLLAVPVEIKKENSANLWLAWRDQLQRLYTIDPAADGYGIYLVLWFGKAPRASPDGERFRDANAMERRLLQCISESDRTRLRVCVLDLSLPS